jgi:hypothetical protein
VSIPGKPDLDHLVRALTADGQPEELGGRDSARAAFLAESQHPAAAPAARRSRGRHPRGWRLPGRRPPGWRYGGAWPGRPLAGLPRRLAAIAAAGVVVVAGLTAAAYARALPGPAQDIAHTVLAPLGLPGGQPLSPPPAVTIATSGAKTGRAGGAPSRAPSPRPGDDYLLTLAASRVRVPSGAVVALSGRVADRGRAVAGTPVRLFERLAGSATWALAGSAVTGPLGGFRLLSPPLTATTVFRAVAGPDNSHSAAVRVTVVSEPRARAASGAGGP